VGAEGRAGLDDGAGEDDGAGAERDGGVHDGARVDGGRPGEVGEGLGDLLARGVAADGDDGGVAGAGGLHDGALHGHAEEVGPVLRRVVVVYGHDVLAGRLERGDDDLRVASPADDDDAHAARPPASAPAVPVNSGMVASPAAEMPSRARTLRRVRRRILRSRAREAWSTYQTSRANFSSQVRALRPLTWAQPVRPGRTSWRRACSGV